MFESFVALLDRCLRYEENFKLISIITLKVIVMRRDDLAFSLRVPFRERRGLTKNLIFLYLDRKVINDEISGTVNGEKWKKKGRKPPNLAGRDRALLLK